jgi:hypothetical protein
MLNHTNTNSSKWIDHCCNILQMILTLFLLCIIIVLLMQTLNLQAQTLYSEKLNKEISNQTLFVWGFVQDQRCSKVFLCPRPVITMATHKRKCEL